MHDTCGLRRTICSCTRQILTSIARPWACPSQCVNSAVVSPSHAVGQSTALLKRSGDDKGNVAGWHRSLMPGSLDSVYLVEKVSSLTLETVGMWFAQNSRPFRADQGAALWYCQLRRTAWGGRSGGVAWAVRAPVRFWRLRRFALRSSRKFAARRVCFALGPHPPRHFLSWRRLWVSSCCGCRCVAVRLSRWFVVLAHTSFVKRTDSKVCSDTWGGESFNPVRPQVREHKHHRSGKTPSETLMKQGLAQVV